MGGKMVIGHGTTLNDMQKIPKEKNPIYGMEYGYPPKGKKYDSDKPMMAQFFKHFSKAYNALVEVATYGFKKYNENLTDPNWRKISIDRYEDAMFRHFSAYLTGDKTDNESGKSHLAHMIWNACVLYELNEVKNENT